MGIRYKHFIDIIMSVKGLFWWINKFTLYFVSREIAICSSKTFYSNSKAGIDRRTIYWKPCKDEEFYKNMLCVNDNLISYNRITRNVRAPRDLLKPMVR